jgi:hypothetical protein
VNFRSLHDELVSIGLSIVPLNALHPDDNTYSVILNQFKGELTFSKDAIGNSKATRGLAVQKFDNFIEVVSHGQFDLAICPEYSCPWQCIDNAIKRSHLPEPGKIWIFGAEGITPKALVEFVQNNTALTWIYDKELISTPNEKLLLDPICIFLKATNKQNETKNVCVIQFKTKHMSVQGFGLREVDVLIEGRFQYIIKNPGASVSLVTMICSDSLGYTHEDVLNEGLETLLLVHIQMNIDPRHHVFKQYRDEIFTGQSVNMEVICLNWAKGSTVAGASIQFSGTGYFTKTEQPVLRDDRLNDNQKRRLYYTFWPQKKSHLYFYPSSENLLCFRTHKASQTLVAAPPHRRRDGAVALPVFSWNEVTMKYEEIHELDGSFTTYCTALQTDLAALSNLPYVDKERFVKLSSASTLSKDCFDIPRCDYFMIDDVEIIKRLTFVDEISQSVIEEKKRSILAVKELIRNFNDPANTPSHLVALQENTTLTYSKSIHPFFNVYDGAKNPIGTILYLGPSVPTEAKSTYNFVNGLILATRPELNAKPLILVWYTDGGLRSYSVIDHKIDSEINENQLSITKE